MTLCQLTKAADAFLLMFKKNNYTASSFSRFPARLASSLALDMALLPFSSVLETTPDDARQRETRRGERRGVEKNETRSA